MLNTINTATTDTNRPYQLQRLHLAFSSTHRTSAWSGGFSYRATTSRTFCMENRSVESLKLLARCGCKPNNAK